MTQFPDNAPTIQVARTVKDLDHPSRDVGLTVTCISNVSELAHFQEDWRRLEALSVDQFTYFQSYDWCLTWCRQYLSDGFSSVKVELSTFVVRRDDTVIMIWPMLLRTNRLGLRLLTLIGDELAQYSSIITDPTSVSDREIARCWDEIKSQSKADAIVLDNIPAPSSLASIHDCPKVCISEPGTSVMDLSGFDSRQKLEASYKSSTRRNRRKRRNKLAGDQELKLEPVHGGSDEFGELTRLAFAWKRDWLRNTGRFNEVVADDQSRDFIADLTDGAIALVLKRAGVPIAIEIGFARGTHYYSYLGAFDWSFQEYSPGKVQIEDALAWMIENDFVYYDLLGAPSTYKDDWSNKQIGLRSYLHPLTFKGYAFAFTWRGFLKPLLKTSFYRLSTKRRKQILDGLRKLFQDMSSALAVFWRHSASPRS